MLKKELCKKCWNKTRVSWSIGIEKFWITKGKVYCPSQYLGKGEGTTRSMTGEPPSKCPFFLEHVI